MRDDDDDDDDDADDDEDDDVDDDNDDDDDDDDDDVDVWHDCHDAKSSRFATTKSEHRPTTDYLLQTKPPVLQQTSNDRLNNDSEILLPLRQVLGIFGSLHGLLVLRLDSGL